MPLTIQFRVVQRTMVQTLGLPFPSNPSLSLFNPKGGMLFMLITHVSYVAVQPQPYLSFLPFFLIKLAQSPKLAIKGVLVQVFTLLLTA